MPFCKQCGSEMESDAGFCVSCGTPAGTTGGNKPSQAGPEDHQKTAIRKNPAYGVVNLEDLPEGHIVDNRYEIKKKLGQGGFGAVYHAFDKKMEIDKALKVLPETIVNDIEAMESIKIEATTMAKLNHPNIVRVYDFQDKGSVKYIDMEYVDGENLTYVKVKSENKTLSESATKNIALKIAKGLSYAHSKNVIHRDIKPANVLVSKTGDIKIMDFGISETVKSSMSRIANSGSSGTLAYMSPEQIMGKDVGREADIYSFGAMMYELLSGKPPFYKGAIEHQILNAEPVPLASVSKAMNEFLQKCLKKDYKERFRNFDEVIATLNGKKIKESKVPAETAGSNKLKWLAVPVIAIIAVLIFFMLPGKEKPSQLTQKPVQHEVKPVPDKPEKKGFFENLKTSPEKDEAYYESEISKTDKKIRGMQERLKSGTKQAGDSLQAMTTLIAEKKNQERDLSSLIKKRKIEEARKREEKKNQFLTRLKKDIQKYKDVVNSEYGESMKDTAWKSLTSKYPDRSNGVEPGDTETLFYGFAKLTVSTVPVNASVKILNIKENYSKGMKLKHGRYKISVKAKDHCSKDISVTLKAGETKTTKVSLIPFGRLYVNTVPSNATVRLLKIKETYKKAIHLKPGSYTVKVSASRCFDKIVKIKVEAGKNEKVSVKLERGFINSLGMKFKYIKPGTFMMGSPLNESGRETLHKVTLTKVYYMQTTEVTQGQWVAIMGNNPSRYKNCGEDCPVEKVSWNDAKEFISKLNKKEGGNKYRLPTEAEWEYACRAGSDTPYANGNSLDIMGWYNSNSGSKTHKVAQKKANDWGLYDMHGNVWEWCEGWKGDYPSGSVTDPTGPKSGSDRVVRGGGWGYDAGHCKSAFRYGSGPGFRFSGLGFRVAFSSGQ